MAPKNNIGYQEGSVSPVQTSSRRAGQGQPSASGRNNDHEFESGSYSSTPNPGANKRAAAGGETNDTKIRRRNRMITSCLECRRRKMKCDRVHPCANCAKYKRDCVFLAPPTDTAGRMKLTELKEKMGRLERSLGRDASGCLQPEGYFADDNGEAANGDYSNPPEGLVNVPADERGLRATEFAVEDAAYEDEADDDTYDLGFVMGKLRVTDRVGGLFRPRLVEELSSTLGCLSITEKDEPSTRAVKTQHPLEALPESVFNPGPTYLAPRSDVFFGKVQRPYSLLDFIPSRVAADRLVEQYWEAVHPIAKVVHRPTFERQYQGFWFDISKCLEPVASLQALVFAVLFAASTSMTEHVALGTFGMPQKKLIENFQVATEVGLGKANFLTTSKLQTLQAFVMYMIPMCRGEVSRAHSALVGTGIRLAECSGLHRDPEEYGMNPIETHARRTLWYQFCFLDLRTSESHGPRQAIRREHFSTKFPLLVDDADLLQPNSHSLNDKSGLTDMTFTRLRFECIELIRILNADRPRLSKGTISLTHVLRKVEAFRRATYDKYGPAIYVPNQRPIQRAAHLMLSIFLCRGYVSVLHPYVQDAKIRAPERLRKAALSSAIQLVEDAIELDTATDLQPWRWYTGTYQQYHAALFILVDVIMHPKCEEADRIWKCLDYVFEIPTCLPSSHGGFEPSRDEIIAHRARNASDILKQMRDRMEAFREMRKPRVSIKMKLAEVPKRSATEPTSPPATRLHEHSHVPSLGPVIDLIPQDDSYVSATTLHPYPGFVSATGTSSIPYQEAVNIPNMQPQDIPQALPQGMPTCTDQSYTGATQPFPSDYSSYPQTQPIQTPYEPVTYLPDIRIDRGGSTSSDESSIGGLWFMSGAEMGGAGVASPISGGAGASTHTTPSQIGGPEEIPMLEIDWDEWDQLFPHQLNNERFFA